jgi:UDPglucose 6-dehydrogenase
VRTFDPYAPERSSAESLKEALSGAGAVVVATAHREFTALNPEELCRQGVVAVLDGRNCLDKERYQEAGLLYSGIGR